MIPSQPRAGFSRTATDSDLLLRGINLPLLDDWNFPENDVLAEPTLTGTNAIRIQWYVNYPNPDRPASLSTI
jgi:hypothetical protein